MLLGVVGDPILHSLSPEIHTAALKFHSIEGSYLRILPQSLDLALEFANEIGIRGFNITSPFKKAAAESLDVRREEVLEFNACNTILFEDGSCIGANTDAVGVVRALESEGILLSGKRILVLGFGGAGRASAFGLFKKGASVIALNRSEVKGTYLFPTDTLSNEKLKTEIRKAEIIVNTLPLAFNIPREFLRSDLTILDANYREESSLASMAKEVGARVISGKKWLFYQAMASSEIFLGKGTPHNVLEEGLRNARGRRHRRVALIGMMGSGKSKAAKALASILGTAPFDSDSFIEDASGAYISDLIRQEGEHKFREIEKEAVLSGIDKGYEVLSLGGGAILDREVREILKENFLAIWLWSPESVCLGRIGDERPFRERFSSILKERAALYGEVSDLVIASNDLTAEEIAKRIALEAHLTNGERH